VEAFQVVDAKVHMLYNVVSNATAMKSTANMTPRRADDHEEAVREMLGSNSSQVETLITSLVASIEERFTATGGTITEVHEQQQRLFELQEHDKQIITALPHPRRSGVKGTRTRTQRTDRIHATSPHRFRT
jgi:hypothetical protein